MPVHPDTYQQQSKLAAYCRTDELDPGLLLRKDRVHHYRRLVYNVIDDNLRSAFPLTVNLLAEDEWNMLVNNFFAGHKAQSPQVWQLPGEFYGYWKSTAFPFSENYPFLLDLLYFEWMEIEVFMMEDIPYPEADGKGITRNRQLLFNPEHRIIHVHFPVHLKPAKAIVPGDKKDYYLLVFREKDTGKVQFIDLSPYYTTILENLLQGLTLDEILYALKDQYALDDPEELLGKTLPFLEKLNAMHFIIGHEMEGGE